MASIFRRFFAVLTVGAMLGLPTFAVADLGYADLESADPNVNAAMKAIDAKDWNKAVDLLTKAVAKDEKNAGLHNLLGYSERNRGNMDASFKHYDRALALDPKHRAAREYVGEAYLMVGNLAKAEEQLAVLDKLCTFSCSEYTKLKTRIAEYKQKK